MHDRTKQDKRTVTKDKNSDSTGTIHDRPHNTYIKNPDKTKDEGETGTRQRKNTRKGNSNIQR